MEEIYLQLHVIFNFLNSNVAPHMFQNSTITKMPRWVRTLKDVGFQWDSIPRRPLSAYICFCTRRARARCHCCPLQHTWVQDAPQFQGLRCPEHRSLVAILWCSIFLFFWTSGFFFSRTEWNEGWTGWEPHSWNAWGHVEQGCNRGER